MKINTRMIIGGNTHHSIPRIIAPLHMAQYTMTPSVVVFCGPSPRISRNTSARIAPETEFAKVVPTYGSMLGRISRNTIFMSLIPDSLARLMNSRLRRLSTCERKVRAGNGQANTARIRTSAGMVRNLT